MHAQHLEAENVSLSFHLQQGARAPAKDSAELRLSRHMEERVADFEGVQVTLQLTSWVPCCGLFVQPQNASLLSMNGMMAGFNLSRAVVHFKVVTTGSSYFGWMLNAWTCWSHL